MSLAKGRPGYADAALKGGDAPPGDGFGGEIERMLMDRPMTRQSFSGSPAPISTSGPGNTLDELMAELGMLRGERGEVSLPDRQLGRNGTRNAPRMSATGDGSLLAGSTDGPLRPSTPRTNAATSAALAASGFVLPPAKGALPANPAAAATSSAGPLGPVRSQSPMSTRRSVTGAINGPSLGGTTSPVGCSAPAVPPPGVLERQVQLETRLEKMELREQQLMALVSQLQQQVSTLSRAQQATQQQLATVATAPPPAQPAVAASQPASVTLPTLAPPAEARQQSPNRAAADAPRPAAAAATAVSDEDYIQNDDGDSPTSSPRPRSDAAAAPSGPQMPPPQQQLQQQQSQRLSTPMPPATGAPGGGGGGGGRPNNKLVPGHTTPAEWELDVSQLRKELGALAANVVRLRDHMVTLVPGGPSPLSEELSAQAAAASQLKQNLTQIAMDVVSLHKGLTVGRQFGAEVHKCHTAGAREDQGSWVRC
ncbi:hypothetical protein Vretifemale_4332 [Volvox reticuliferus]|uniref:Uncharacterized protein n=1 Tax=Volvox reticuliferus TaxID=1737510 RepID=A0A8J4FFL5_9CHLO|nr:hypothetical protein Vretifemale_4332 [Volvox reticuliferus]